MQMRCWYWHSTGGHPTSPLRPPPRPCLTPHPPFQGLTETLPLSDVMAEKGNPLVVGLLILGNLIILVRGGGGARGAGLGLGAGSKGWGEEVGPQAPGPLG